MKLLFSQKLWWLLFLVASSIVFNHSTWSLPSIEQPPEVLLTKISSPFLSVSSTDEDHKNSITVSTQTKLGLGEIITSYQLEVISSEGLRIFEISESLSQTDKGLFGWQGNGLSLPEEFIWDGNSNSGVAVPDGEYEIQLTVVDSSGQAGLSDAISLIIDSTSPKVTLKVRKLSFSPDGDGIRDLLVVRQEGSYEQEWSGKFYDNSNLPVAVFIWKGQPRDFVWDGRKSNGSRVQDGSYHYELSAVDQAGNKISKVITDIVVDTRNIDIALMLDRIVISPNGDGVADFIVFLPEIGDLNGINEWELLIHNADGELFYKVSGQGFVPPEIIYDGLHKEKLFLPEGVYTGELTVRYDHGFSPSIESPEFLVDLTPPFANIKSDTPIFSPNADGYQDFVQFSHTVLQPGVRWIGEIIKNNKVIVSTYRDDFLDAVTSWSGYNKDGELSPDGQYFYRLRSTDEGGNSWISDPVLVELDNEETQVNIGVSSIAFSPDGNKLKDKITFLPYFKVPHGIEKISLKIVSPSGKLIRNLKESSSVFFESEWNGLDNNGELVSDGEYFAEIEVYYLKGDYHLVRSNKVLVDTQAPILNIKPSYYWFSPDGDGRRDVITFEQQSSEEDTWTAVIRPANGMRKVRTYSWQGRLEDFIWDGLDSRGNRVRDGFYRYQVSSTDFAGNTTSFTINNIRSDSRDTSILITPEYRGFSPNGDGNRDTLILRVFAAVNEGIKEWSLKLNGENYDDEEIIKGFDSLPERFFWDGSIDSEFVAEGEYELELLVSYEKGNISVTTTEEPIVVDLTPPQFVGKAENLWFSPEGDSLKDFLKVYQESSEESYWEGRIIQTEGSITVKSFFWESRAGNFTWDGLNDDGAPVKDGMYSYELRTEDATGQHLTWIIPEIRVDRQPTPILIETERSAFSPNNDGVFDNLKLDLFTAVSEGVDSWQITTFDQEGESVIIANGNNSVPNSIIWDGTLNGQLPSEGFYRLELLVSYEKGNVSLTATEDPVLVDLSLPHVSGSAPFLWFSPDGDGRKDSLVINQASTEELEWLGKILTVTDNRIIKNFSWRGNAGQLVWDAKDESGIPVKDGFYKYVVDTQDMAGHKVSWELDGIQVDRQQTPIYLTVSNKSFSPNSDGLTDHLIISPEIGIKDGLKGWYIQAIHNKEEQFSDVIFSGDNQLERELKWDGRINNNKPEGGIYDIKFVAEYAKGNVAEVSLSNKVILDILGPELRVDIMHSLFSPDGDGQNDLTAIALTAEDPSLINDWSIEVQDPYDRVFYREEGKGAIPEFWAWDGRNQLNEVVQSATDYKIVISATDNLGNKNIISTTLTVDVLVEVKEGKRRIRISSIHFPPFSANLFPVDESREYAAKNRKTLIRLAQILNRFNDSKIKIEGHAVSLLWFDNVRALEEQNQILLPLSRDRANSVRSALSKLGVSIDRMTAEGKGGLEPLVPHGDVLNRWKNRRVEFILAEEN